MPPCYELHLQYNHHSPTRDCLAHPFTRSFSFTERVTVQYESSLQTSAELGISTAMCEHTAYNVCIMSLCKDLNLPEKTLGGFSENRKATKCLKPHHYYPIYSVLKWNKLPVEKRPKEGYPMISPASRHAIPSFKCASGITYPYYTSISHQSDRRKYHISQL